ncbi:hypothetical protein [Paraburkholderia sp. J12]|uniref:hypothetical protein n=1 Tax=Paraburkholderia sp. J12 TaxID=2805432 RepID=UPI002ABDB512|nr:hypothetical protein [Paraburkholderia sp. J12]
MKKILMSLSSSLILVACSTGTPPGAPGPQAQSATNLEVSSAGIYSGTFSTQAPVTLLSLYDGSAYLFYQKPVAGVIVVMHGQQTPNGHFSGGSATEYRFAPNAAASPVQVQIDFSRAPNVSGTVVASEKGATPMTFDATAEPSLGQGPGLGAIAGEYSGQMSSLQGNGAAQLLIARDGLLAGTTSAGCEFRGSVSPDSGVNAYRASFTFGAAPCAVPNATVTGRALLQENRLLIALPKPDRSDVVVFDGTR